MNSGRMPVKANGRFTRIGYKIAGRQRMETQGSLKRIAVVFAIVAGINFLIVSQKSIIHSDSDKGGIT